MYFWNASDSGLERLASISLRLCIRISLEGDLLFPAVSYITGSQSERNDEEKVCW